MKNFYNKARKREYFRGRKTMPCQYCDKMFDREHITVHHIIPQEHMRALGEVLPDIIPEQKFAFLCRPCHDKVEWFYKRENRTTLIDELKVAAINADSSTTIGNIYAYILNAYTIIYDEFLLLKSHKGKHNFA